MKKIAFIGVGRMGKPMVKNLVRLGFDVNIYARAIMKVYDVISNGAKYHSSVSDCVKDCSVIITMLGIPKDVEEIYFAKGGVLDSAPADAYVIDMTTTSPTLAKMISDEGTKRGLHVLDAPVTGGVSGAKNARLSIMVGGTEEDYKACLPLFRAMGTNINYMGEAGMGQHAKLANQIMVAGAIAGVCEGMTYAKSKGLDMSKFLRAVSTGGAGSKQLDTAAPKILDRDFTPGFSIKHFVKDMLLAIDESNKEHLGLDVLVTVMSHYQKLEKDGFSENGIQTLIKYYGG
ncbi:MAG: NAD(P)-dependent oxidoreductase [Synergistales bacterium]|nr:NAD(P)-dependent oxidoreductase [Synergistales bacterium]MDY6401617.1 NAD(P)-dependent oxidoreductase [Synergistales bacterium]MDY6404313.1 NAD(P)-dependent oxidoreductase [Synergistales bacterium]MDY6410673.1 NAD(P)-dependent oxidoreductase [Synergistales bacterium]MDY6414014.1 NAD(P)-dependent oxidoreductase [Synergistales bacterium]